MTTITAEAAGRAEDNAGSARSLSGSTFNDVTVIS